MTRPNPTVVERDTLDDGTVVAYYTLTEWEPPASYFLDLYGKCSKGAACLCLRPHAVWLGRACANWIPFGVESHAGLSDHFARSQKPPPPPTDL